MPRNRRQISTFNLSFLDIMSCGFGAVVLLFLIIKHKVEGNVSMPIDTGHRASEVAMLDEEILEGKQGLAKVRNTISEVDDELAVAQGLASRIMEEQQETAALTEEVVAGADSVELETLKTRIRSLEQQNQQIKEEIAASGQDARRIAGEGKQQYLTGLTVEGEHLLILLDASASMLDNTIVNIIRFRNMRDGLKRNARKWQKALKTVEWLTARFPAASQYQVYIFNTDARPALPDSGAQWLEVRDSAKLESVVKSLYSIVPENGTSLEKAFTSAGRLRPLPDNIYLITDGLPTQGSAGPRSQNVSSRDRLELFKKSLKALPPRVPVNVILSPLEGDPDAAPAFWGLAQVTNGSFMIPSEDWP